LEDVTKMGSLLSLVSL